ncbi:MAG TPA: DUF6129 family protein [Rhodocyclaceae bacterium]|nr:DUF6129 family protein [Rhodocyclaceae bacterium]
MSNLTPTLLAQVAEAACLNPALASLRAAFPGLHLSECSADDVNARLTPALETDSHAFYLVSNCGGHCLSLTADFETASGIVIAAKDPD